MPWRAIATGSAHRRRWRIHAIGVAAVCAHQARPTAHHHHRPPISCGVRGEYLPLAGREAAAYPYSAADRERIVTIVRGLHGTVETVRTQLDPLLAATKADEVMVTTMIYDHAAAAGL